MHWPTLEDVVHSETDIYYPCVTFYCFNLRKSVLNLLSSTVRHAVPLCHNVLRKHSVMQCTSNYTTLVGAPSMTLSCSLFQGAVAMEFGVYKRPCQSHEPNGQRYLISAFVRTIAEYLPNITGI